MRQSRKIVIPNDFSVRPMLLLEKIMESNPNVNFDILMLHGIYPPEGLGNLLFFSKMEVFKNLENESYVKEYCAFMNKFKSRITAMHSDLITSTSSFSLNLFLKSNNIEEVYVPDGLHFKFSGRDSFNLIPLLKKSNIPVRTLLFQVEKDTELSSEVAPLFRFDLSQFLINSI
ncbi:hypothetical protein [uncultured Arcticibacterium sp.]|uniref:hypothetical protein n=1 Tax=uncultured Arcticibacterium sp. TaxID=2173042 RepID=UPI0030F8E0A6